MLSVKRAAQSFQASSLKAFEFRALGFGALTIGALSLATPVPLAQAAVVKVAALPSATLPLSVPSPEILEANQLSDQGVEAFTQGDRPAAFDYWQRAMLLYRSAGDRT